jgi:transcription antitermination factor NusB
MKGRRQARRAALQALYELDQSTHPLDVVLAGRVEALYEAGLDSTVPPALRDLSRRVLAACRDCALHDDDVRRLAAALGETTDHVATVAAALRPLVPQAEYLQAVVRGVARHREQLDAVIHGIAPEWPVVQMAPVDRNVLRIALWEIGSGSSPTRVAISEAVELARTFSGEGARRMVNGALGTFAASGTRLDLAGDVTPCPP